MNTFDRDRGSVLVVVLIMAVVVGGFCVVTLLMAGAESRGAHAAVLRDKALFAASAGLEDQLKAFRDVMKIPPSFDAFAPFRDMVGKTVISQRQLVTDGLAIAEYSVVVDSLTLVDAQHADVTLTAVGFVPSAVSPNAVSRTVHAVVRLCCTPSEVFQYVVFTNNYGWFGDSAHEIFGNIRTNGVCNFAGQKWNMAPYPRFETVENGRFINKIDDGGAYSGWDMVGADDLHVKIKQRSLNPGGTEYWLTPNCNHIPMPNLSNMAPYERDAKANNSSIKIGKTVVCDAVVGDGLTEKPNLFLDGSNAKAPILLSGTVVVRGDLFIKGTVTGRGSIYVKGNIYIGGNLTYLNKLSPPPPVGGDVQALMEETLAKDSGADALGLFTGRNIVVGDVTDALWQAEIAKALSDPKFGNGEDNGEDGIPNTRAGRDGILGTADDDVLESDGIWTVERYKSAQALHGVIPAGSGVGDPILGTGEDTDGDGKYSPPVKAADLVCRTSLTSSQWAGNFPAAADGKPYSYFCDRNDAIIKLDGAYCAGNIFAMYAKKASLSGCVVANIMSTFFYKHDMFFAYDLGLLQTNTPATRQLPRTWKAPQMVMWRSN